MGSEHPAKQPMKTPYERAAAYAAKVEGAVSGQGGHSVTYDLARVLVYDFALSEAESLQILEAWNIKCSPPWSRRELEHKVRQAATKPHATPRGSKLTTNAPHSTVSETGRFIISRSTTPAPVLGGDSAESTIAFLKSAFLSGETVCICTQSICDDDGKHRPASHGTFKPLEWFIAEIEAGSNPFTCDSEAGRWVRINPYKADAETGADANVSVYRHVLVEFDDLSEADQLHVLRESNLPLTGIVSSGGRSYHGWVRVDAPDKATWEQRRDVVYTYLEDAHPCPANKNAGRFSRLAGVKRGEAWQRLVSLKTGPETWEEFEAWLRRRDLPQAMTLRSLRDVEIDPDPTCILGNRWLCEGGSLTIVSSSGVGKSSFALQFAVAMATATPFFGICNKQGTPLKVGIVQAENDWGDVREAADGAQAWLCSLGRGGFQDKALLDNNLRFFRENSKTGGAFLSILRQIIKEHLLQVVFIDPLMAYFGDDTNNQKAMSVFLRNTLQPILDETKCVAVLIHHTAKPRVDTAKSNASDVAYLGAGSSELTNWSREIAVLQREPDKDDRRGAFILTLCKRAGRSGLVDANDRLCGRVRLDHARDAIFWQYASDENETTFTVERKWTSREPKSKRGNAHE